MKYELHKQGSTLTLNFRMGLLIAVRGEFGRRNYCIVERKEIVWSTKFINMTRMRLGQAASVESHDSLDKRANCSEKIHLAPLGNDQGRGE